MEYELTIKIEFTLIGLCFGETGSPKCIRLQTEDFVGG